MLHGDAPTERQLAILRFIAQETESDGFPPTVRELGDKFGISSTNGVRDHLMALVTKGLLERPKMKARGLKLTARGWLYVAAGQEPRCPKCHQVIRRAA